MKAHLLESLSDPRCDIPHFRKVTTRWLLFGRGRHLSAVTLALEIEKLLPTQQRMRTPAEPMPPPVKEPPAPEENPDAPVREPDPEEPEMI